jgi:hypothetical protein
LEAEIDLFNLPALFGNDPRCGLGGLRFLVFNPFLTFRPPNPPGANTVLAGHVQHPSGRNQLQKVALPACGLNR